MAFTPLSTVYLLDTPLDNTYKNQLYFSSLSSQINYFKSKIKHQFNDVTYQRKDNVVRVNKNIDALWNVNYAMYQNENFSSKWFYAFITKMEYVSANVTDVFIETDVYQTWRFECELKKSFVVREHVSDDAIGKNLVDEQLETGEYKMSEYAPFGKINGYWNVIAVSDNSPLNNSEKIGNLYGNIVSGLTFYPFPNTTEGITWLKDFINAYDTAGKPDAIVMIFTIPDIGNNSIDDAWTNKTPIASGVAFNSDNITLTKNVNDVDGYTPKNNKLLTYPYKFLYASNNGGQSATYRYEDFDNPSDYSKMDFVIFCSITPDPTVMLAPKYYRGEGAGIKYEYGLTLKGFPMGSWNSDTFTAWFAQNSLSTGVTLGASTVALLGGIATANPIAIMGGIVGVFSQMAQIQKASIQPDQAKGQVGGGTLQYAISNLDFYYAHMTIKKEFAERIDNYFTMYGYKVNKLKVPNTHSRAYWNYIQTIDVNIDGSIPDNDMRRLKEMYNSGVTLWHNPSYFLDYSKDNYILGQ